MCISAHDKKPTLFGHYAHPERSEESGFPSPRPSPKGRGSTFPHLPVISTPPRSFSHLPVIPAPPGPSRASGNPGMILSLSLTAPLQGREGVLGNEKNLRGRSLTEALPRRVGVRLAQVSNPINGERGSYNPTISLMSCRSLSRSWCIQDSRRGKRWANVPVKGSSITSRRS